MPFRPDHGHEMLDDVGKPTHPGYPAIGRMRGLAEIRGVMTALAQQNGLAALTRLCAATLATLPAGVARPRYDRGAVASGIVHLGLGAFHRAHQAAYTDAVLAAGDTRWGITAASLRSAATRDALGPQDGLYTLDVRGETDRLAVIGSVLRVLVAPEDPAPCWTRCAPRPRAIVSLTVTEKAYCRDAASGALDEAHPDIVHDLAHPEAPRSALGLLAAADRPPPRRGTPPFTVLCCDNLPANGRAVHRAAHALRHPALARPGRLRRRGGRLP